MGGFRARGTTNRCTPHPIENRARPMTVWLEVRQVAHLLQTLYADYSHKLRRRKGSGDLPGLQSRRFGSSRAEWWVRLPHASANLIVVNHLARLKSKVLIERNDWPPRFSIASRWDCGIT